MKVLFFTKYSRLGASSRLRTYQFIPFYEEKGLECTISYLFDDDYLGQLYKKGGISKWTIIKSYLRRLVALLQVYKYNLIVIEKELFPFLPATVEILFSWFRIKYVVDYDDAIFHNYDTHPNPVIKSILGNKIATVMKHSSLVVAGNNYLKEYAIKSLAKNVVVVPTVVDTSQYLVKDYSKSKELIIGWIGSPTSFHNLDIIIPALKEICETYPVKIHLVGSHGGIGLDKYEVVIPWSEDNEVELIRGFDIGIMPLKDDKWQKGKCGYKLIQYMGCALPVIGSPVGANDDIIVESVNGYKPSDLEGWSAALTKLVVDDRLRISMGNEGRKLVDANFSLVSAAKVLLHNFMQLKKNKGY